MADPTLYNEQDRKLMQISYASRCKSRLHELIEFAKNSGMKRIGIASCRTMMTYAPLLKKSLENAGFEVFLTDCKESGLKNSDILGDDYKGPSCDPASQAEYLNNCQTELNIDFGLCLGHGLIFAQKSKAPVTAFVVKDFATNHNTLSSLND